MKAERVRVIVPDSHGCEIDTQAEAVFLADLKRLAPHEIVMLGDHVDYSGIFNEHAPSVPEETDYSHETDEAAANRLLDAVQRAAPRAGLHYLEGNHEQHVERYAVRHLAEPLREKFLKDNGPQARLRVKDRGIRYYRRSQRHGLSIPGSIQLGRCCFTHGFTASKFATERHVSKFGYNVVHGHTHRAQEYRTRTVHDEAIGGWCPGTLAQLQPLYLGSNLSEWTHGYAVQFVAKSGLFLHVNVPIIGGKSMLLIQNGSK